MIKLKFLFFVLLSCLSFSQVNDFKNISFNKADKIAYEFKGENLKLRNDFEKIEKNIEGVYLKLNNSNLFETSLPLIKCTKYKRLLNV